MVVVGWAHEVPLGDALHVGNGGTPYAAAELHLITVVEVELKIEDVYVLVSRLRDVELDASVVFVMQL
jgi:hypothetical protein